MCGERGGGAWEGRVRACSGGRGSVRSAAKCHRVAVRSGCAAGAGQSRLGSPGRCW